MSDPTGGRHGPAPEPLDEKTREQWLRLSAVMAAANAGPGPSWVNEELDAAAHSEPQSPVAPAYRLWMADNLAREAHYPEAVRTFDSAIDLAQSARRLLSQVDPTHSALLHKAQAATLGGDAKLAISTYLELARVSATAAEPLFRAGWVAETDGDDEQAARLYGSAASTLPISNTDDPAELARRALRRLEDPETSYRHTVLALSDLLASSLESGDIGQLDRLISKTHFAAGPIGGHTAFEEPELLEKFYRDLLESSVSARRKLAGSGDKRYLTSTGWKGEWFRGDVVCLLSRAPKGWQWTGVAVSHPHAGWVERWRPATKQTNQPPSVLASRPVACGPELQGRWPHGVPGAAGGHPGRGGAPWCGAGRRIFQESMWLRSERLLLQPGLDAR